MTREEAIKILRDVHDKALFSVRNALETLIPELRESVSEDERTRRELVKFISDIKSISESGRTTWAIRSDDAKMCETFLAYLEKQKEQKPVMIQWTGKNLKEVIDFTSKSPRFDEWFKSWEEFEDYVHSHDDILKLFCEDGSHYEVPVGAWIVKTPDGYNIPSRFRFIQKPAECLKRKINKK